MILAPIPSNEVERLNALKEYEILDTSPELPFDDLARLASIICGTPMAFVSLVDEHRHWIKANVGLPLKEAPRDISFCGHAILTDRVFIVPDASTDKRFHDNPHVKGDAQLRFYAGAKLISPHGYALGTLCVLDKVPRSLTREQEVTLEILARQVVQQMELHRTNKTLKVTLEESQLARRKIEEQQIQLVQAAKMTSLGEMAGGVAHEINNPLAIISGKANLLIESLQAGNLDPERAEAALRKIEETSFRIAKIVKGLLSFSRDSQYEAAVVGPLGEIVDDALSLAGEKLRNSGVALDVQGARTDFSVECRRMQLSQVVLNLLSNAFDAVQSSREKWIKIEERLDGEFAEIRVIDSGHGVPKEVRNRIMEPFFTTKPLGKGTGLGLSISKGIMESHGGTLTLDTKSKFTTFIVRFPRKQDGMKRDAA